MTIRQLIATILALTALCAAGADTTAVWRYVPDVHGTFRVGYEYRTEGGESRFMVRNARLTAGGFVLPRTDYFLQVDLCDRGKMKILDAFIRIEPARGLKLTAGQTRLPFSTDAWRLPHKYWFFNRSFIGKYSGNLRSVGVKASYTLPSVPLCLEGGIFNSTSMSDHSQWNSHMTYAAKVKFESASGWTPQASFMSRVPGGAADGLRVNLADASLSWHNDRWWLEGEYLYAHCQGGFPAMHEYNLFAAFTQPLQRHWIKKLTFEARYDGHNPLTDGLWADNGRPAVTTPARRRITGGATASTFSGAMHLDFRLDYEHYFYHKSDKAPEGEESKISASICLYF